MRRNKTNEAEIIDLDINFVKQHTEKKQGQTVHMNGAIDKGDGYTCRVSYINVYFINIGKPKKRS